MKLPLLGPFPAAHDLYGGTPGNRRNSAPEPRVKCHLRCVLGPLAPPSLFLHLSDKCAEDICFVEIQSLTFKALACRLHGSLWCPEQLHDSDQ